MISRRRNVLPPLNIQKFSNKIKTLQQICEQCIMKNYTIVEECEEEGGSRISRIKETVPYIQPMFGNILMKMMLEVPARYIDDILTVYSDSQKCGIQQIAIRNQQMSFRVVEKFVSKQLSLAHLKICYCRIGSCTYQNTVLLLCKEHIISFHLQCVDAGSLSGSSMRSNNTDYHNLSNTRHPNLKCLRLIGVECGWFMILNKFDVPHLNFLELSQYSEKCCPKGTEKLVEKLNNDPMHSDLVLQSSLSPEPTADTLRNPLLQFYRINLLKSTLKSLVLHNTWIGKKDLEVIYELENLELLDLSMSIQATNELVMVRPSIKLHEIVDRFPKLRSLDVSSTAIGNTIHEDSVSSRGSNPGSRDFWDVFLNRKLDFLGLLDCSGGDFYAIYHIAQEVSGSYSVLQLLTAIERCMDRIPELIYASKRLYQQHYESTPEHNVRAIKLMMEAVTRYPTSETLLANLCVNIYGMMRSDYCHFNAFQKREMIRLLVEIINTDDQIFRASTRVIRIALLSLEHFKFPTDCGQDFEFVIDKLMKILQHYSEDEIGKVAIHECNMIVCNTEQDVKVMLSRTNFVQSIMAVIRKKLRLKICDEVMTLSWGTLWNVSDETPQNSSTFIQNGGIELMMNCFEVFSTNDVLRKSAVGFVGNIAEVQSLRPHFMKESLLQLFLQWTEPKNENSVDIELAYHACGTLSHLLSDGEAAWTISHPSRDVVRAKIYEAVNSWNIEAPRQVNYRSFVPILSLVHRGVEEASHWAVWALCNLIKFDGDYRRILEREGAYEILSTVTVECGFFVKTVELAQKVIEMLGVGQSSNYAEG